MKYKVGDKVRVKSLEWYNNNTSNADFIYCANFIPFTQRMSIWCGCVMTIKSIQSNNIYLVEENLYAWTEDMFEGLADYKENVTITLNGKDYNIENHFVWTEDMFEGLADYKENVTITLNGKDYNIDVEKAKELGVLKEKDLRCKSWEEFKKKYLKKQGYFYDECDMCIALTNNPTKVSEQLTENEAIAIKAFSKLLKLRRDWIGDWDPDWCNGGRIKFCIDIYKNDFCVTSLSNYSKTFSFPTEEMAIEFLKHFRDLFEQCKMLI